MRSFKYTYDEIKQHHSHTLKFLNSSIAFIDISNVCKRIEKRGVHAYDKFLTEWEYSYIDKIKVPKRKIDFLCGRLAGKRAVKRHLLKNAGSPAAIDKDRSLYKDIEIRRTVTGRPVVLIRKEASFNKTADFYISISHTEGVAASLVSSKSGCKGIGIDIEKIEERDNSLFNVAFTDNEILNITLSGSGGNTGDKQKTEEVARYWSIKEAVMKSMGVGVNIDLKDIEVVNTQDYAATVSLKNGAMDRFILLEGIDLKVESTRIEDFMISIACLY